MTDFAPWQLQVFDKTLKKKIKAELIKQRLGDLDDTRCLMISCGENNGAMNYHLRKLGGSWAWAEFEAGTIDEMQMLLGDPVLKLSKDRPMIPLENETLDLVIALDAHEHLEDPQTFTTEIARIIKPGGRVLVSVPNGNKSMTVSRMKKMTRMHDALYGHLVPGYDIAEMEQLLGGAGLSPSYSAYYSKFFTELLELVLNLAYVRFFSKSDGSGRIEQTVAPTTEEQIAGIRGGFKVYGYVYPLFRLVSSLDALLPWQKGYAVLVEAVKAGS